MIKSDQLRQPIQIEGKKEFVSKMENALEQMMKCVQEFKEQWEVKEKVQIADCFMQPRELEYDLDKSLEENGKESLIAVTANDSMRFNQLFSLIKISDLTQVSVDALDAQYIISGLFSNDSLQSNYKVLLLAKKKSTLQLIDKILEIRSSDFSEFNVETLLHQKESIRNL